MCIYVSMCMYICVYVCIYVHICVYMCVYAFMYIYIYVVVYIYIYVVMCIYVFMCIYILYVYVCVCSCSFVCCSYRRLTQNQGLSKYSRKNEPFVLAPLHIKMELCWQHLYPNLSLARTSMFCEKPTNFANLMNRRSCSCKVCVRMLALVATICGLAT